MKNKKSPKAITIGINPLTGKPFGFKLATPESCPELFSRGFRLYSRPASNGSMTSGNEPLQPVTTPFQPVTAPTQQMFVSLEEVDLRELLEREGMKMEDVDVPKRFRPAKKPAPKQNSPKKWKQGRSRRRKV